MPRSGKQKLGPEARPPQSHLALHFLFDTGADTLLAKSGKTVGASEAIPFSPGAGNQIPPPRDTWERGKGAREGSTGVGVGDRGVRRIFEKGH